MHVPATNGAAQRGYAEFGCQPSLDVKRPSRVFGQCSSINVDIEGHTFNVGEDAYNLTLSERRAQSVAAWLTQNGIGAAAQWLWKR
jgi:hypothetical protein